MVKEVSYNSSELKELKNTLDRVDIKEAFPKSRLDLLKHILECEQERSKSVFKLIVQRDGHTHDNGMVSPTFVTICKSPHWGKREGIMFTGSIYDATKFDYNYKDLHCILGYLKSKYPDRHLEIIDVDKAIFSSRPREVWSNENIHCDFYKTGSINSEVVVQYSI